MVTGWLVASGNYDDSGPEVENIHVCEDIVNTTQVNTPKFRTVAIDSDAKVQDENTLAKSFGSQGETGRE